MSYVSPDAGDVVESRAVGLDHFMTEDELIIVDNSGSQSLQGGVCRSVQDGARVAAFSEYQY